MRYIWQIALQEYRRNVFKKGFILLLISVPIFILFSVGIGVYMESVEDNDLPVGYVDFAGVFNNDLSANNLQSIWEQEYEEGIEFIQANNKEEALDMLNTGSIQVFYVLPDDYMDTRHIEEFYYEKPGENAEWQFYDFLQLNLLSTQQVKIAKRVAFGSEVIKRSIDGKRTFNPGGPTFGLLMPLFLTMAFLFMILMSSGYTLKAFADEKENRTMEMLITSISTSQLVTGKILGIVAIGVTLIGSWMIEILIGVLIAQKIGINWFMDLSMDWRTIFATLVIGIPAYALVIALMTAIGGMVTNSKEGQSVSSIFVILHLIPLYISWSFINNPHSTLALILSLCPFTSLLTIGVRNLFTIVPAWQILVNIAIQLICLLGALKLAGKSLQIGLLRYGQRLTWRRLISGKRKGEERI